MGVYIKDMEMPRNCDDCHLDIDCAYDESQDGYKMIGGRPRKCPLVHLADVQSVVQGKWIQDCDYHFRCSICGDRWIISNGHPLDFANGWNFCPNCGADMREES